MRGPSADLHVVFFFFLCSALLSGTMSCKLPPFCSPHILNSIFLTWGVLQALPGFSLLPLPILWPGNSLKAINWERLSAWLLLFPMSQGSQPFIAWYPVSWKLLFLYILFVFGSFRKEHKFSSYYSILVKNTSSSIVLSN